MRERRGLAGRPPGELAGVDADAARILGPAARELHERAREAVSWEQRFAVIDELLLGQRGGTQAVSQWVSPEVPQAWRVLLASGGTASVGYLARESGWSTRRLGTRFRTEIG